MARIQGAFSSEHWDEPYIWQDTDDEDVMLYHHDVHDRTFILGVNLGDSKGANIYKFDKLDTDQASAFEKVVELMTPDNVYQNLIPWGKSDQIPTRLDNGEKVFLTISHLPDVRINYVRGEDLYEL